MTENNDELEGKIVLISEDIQLKINYSRLYTVAAVKDIKGIIYENKTSDEEKLGDRLLSYVHLGNLFAADIDDGYIMIRVNKTSFKELVRYANEGKYAHIKTDYSVDSKEVANVIGYIPGSDSNLKDEYLLITAHLDHNGDNKDGTYNPGALDNASGVSVMMEIARVIQENNIKPKKSVVFIAFNGEEQGLLGSQYYVRKPVLPLDKAEVINLDMVGSKEDVPLYISSYSDMKTELRNKLYVYSKDLELGIDIKLSNSASSDSTSFQEKDVDAITLIDHDWKSGYHSPKDTIDLIDSSRIEKISKLILYYIDKTCY